MNIVQVLVTIVVIIISYHIVGLALEAHAFATSIAGHSIASINSLNRHLTLVIWTFSNVVILHVLFK